MSDEDAINELIRHIELMTLALNNFNRRIERLETELESMMAKRKEAATDGHWSGAFMGGVNKV